MQALILLVRASSTAAWLAGQRGELWPSGTMAGRDLASPANPVARAVMPGRRHGRHCGDPALKAATPSRQTGPQCAGVVIRQGVIGRRERRRRRLGFSRPLGRGDQTGAPRLRVSGQTAGACADQLQDAANSASRRGRPRAHESAPGRPRRSSVAAIRIAGTAPASPPRSRAVWDGRQPLQPPLRRPGAMRLSWRAKRLRFGRHRVAALPHHCRPQGFPRPPCPSPENRTRGGGRRHGASDTPRQRER